MYKCLTVGVSLILFIAGSQAQQMNLVSGTLTVAAGTTMRLVGPVEWTLAPGATVVNDGLIDLGAEATLTEQVNSPVTGNGVEQATTNSTAPFNNIQPGNLGLTISATSGPSPITVYRGHSAQEFPQGDQSISRWFQITPSTAPFSDLDLVLDYDPTELNGLDAANLGLFETNSLSGPWNPLASIPDPGSYSVTGTYQGPWDFITAFDINAPTASPSLIVQSGFSVFPTIVENVLHIVALDQQRITTVELLDGLGRSVPFQRNDLSSEHARITPSDPSPGAYFLRLNGIQVFKLRVL